MKRLLASILAIAMLTASCAAAAPMPTGELEIFPEPHATLLIVQCNVAIGVIVVFDNGAYEAVSFAAPVGDIEATFEKAMQVAIGNRQLLDLPPPGGCPDKVTT